MRTFLAFLFGWLKPKPLKLVIPPCKPRPKGIYKSFENIPYGSGMGYETMPILNLPPDTVRVRRRIRCNDFVRIYVRTPNGIREYESEIEGEGLRLLHPTAQNVHQ